MGFQREYKNVQLRSTYKGERERDCENELATPVTVFMLSSLLPELNLMLD